MRNDIAIIALEYLEPEWQQTLECVKATGLDYYIAKRDGVGNMSRAFNECFFGNKIAGKYKYVWFVTNITFDMNVPFALSNVLWFNNNIAGIHPYMNSSDHISHHLSSGVTNSRVYFIELTAPMFRTDNFYSLEGFDNNLWYYYMDLDICHKLRLNGKELAVCNTAGVEHVYLRNNKSKHPVSEIRKQLRDYIAPLNKQYMEQKWGKGWEQLLKWK